MKVADLIAMYYARVLLPAVALLTFSFALLHSIDCGLRRMDGAFALLVGNC
jgi:hypothetical protein